jgi:hypothetical protein
VDKNAYQIIAYNSENLEIPYLSQRNEKMTVSSNGTVLMYYGIVIPWDSH